MQIGLVQRIRAPMKLSFFTKPDCQLCDAAYFVVRKVADSLGVHVTKIDISAAGNGQWHEQYQHDIPVVHLDGEEIFRHRVNERELRRLLERHRAK